MKIKLLALIVAGLLPLNLGAVELVTFYAECELGLIDTNTGTSTPLGTVGNWSIEAMDYGPDGRLYATVENSCWVHGNANTLATVDLATQVVTPIGAIAFDDVDALAFHPDGTLYAVSQASYELITIDTTTGLGTPVDYINGVPGTFLGTIDFMPDGTLMLIDMADAGGGPSNLYTLDPATAIATLVGPLDFDSVEGMSIGPDGQIFALARSMEGFQEAELVSVDPISGAGTLVQYMPLPLPDYEGARDALVIRLIEALIDIKPGSDPNCFNINGHGVVPVAVLGSETFDVSMIDYSSLSLGGLQVRIRGKKGPMCHIEYSNADAFLDLVCLFQDDASAWAPGGDMATLSGHLLDGTPFEGSDSICVVPQ